jgi:hypothetical protein
MRIPFPRACARATLESGERQLIRFFRACLDSEANGLVEKSRDMGATWCAAAFSV